MSKGTLLDAISIAALFVPLPGVNVFLAAAIRASIVISASYAKSKLARSGALENQIAGSTLNVMSNEAVLPVVYGTAKVGMILADVQQDSAQVKTIAVVGALCMGSEDGTGIESVTKVYFDDVLAIDGPTATTGATNNTNVQSPWKTGTTYGTDLWVQYGLQLGADAQAADTELVSRFANWTATDEGVGAC